MNHLLHPDQLIKNGSPDRYNRGGTCHHLPNCIQIVSYHYSSHCYTTAHSNPRKKRERDRRESAKLRKQQEIVKQQESLKRQRDFAEKTKLWNETILPKWNE